MIVIEWLVNLSMIALIIVMIILIIGASTLLVEIKNDKGDEVMEDKHKLMMIRKMLQRVSDITLRQIGGKYVVYQKDGDIYYIQKDVKNKSGGQYFIYMYGHIIGCDPLHQDSREVMLSLEKTTEDMADVNYALKIIKLISSNAERCDVYD